MSELNSNNKIKESLQSATNDSIALDKQSKVSSGSVRPLFCFKVSPEGYFRFYTILLLVMTSINILGSSLLSFGPHPIPGISQILFDIVFLSLAAVSFSKYDDTGNYGQDLHYCFSITILVFSIISVVASALVPVFLFIFGLGDFAAGWLDLKGRVTLWIILVIYLVIIIPILSFNCYLSYLYKKVITWKRNQIQKEKQHQRDIALTDHVDSNA